MSAADDRHEQVLRSLTPKSNLTVLLRTLFLMVTDYCVLPGEDAGNTIVFTKEQLISLIERSDPETTIADIPVLSAKGFFKPIDNAALKSLPNPEELRVLVVEECEVCVSSLTEALVPRTPNFPEWWEAPVPFAMFGYGRIHINQTAMLMFGAGLKRLSVRDLPDKDEFLVKLESGESACSLTFRKIEQNIFLLDDCTGDLEAATDITWWAAVGKAWTTRLAEKKHAFRKCDASEIESLGPESLVLPCEWDGDFLGYFCVEKGEADPKRKSRSGKNEKGSAAPKQRPRLPSSSPGERKGDALSTLGPQVMGFLTLGTNFLGPEEDVPEKSSRRKTEPKTKKTAPKGAMSDG